MGNFIISFSMFEFKSTVTLTLADKTLGTNTAQVNTTELTEAPQTKSSNSHFAVVTLTYVGMTF